MNTNRNPMRIELHCHTLFSVDVGQLTPEALVDVAVEREIATLSITEHNSLGSLKRARKYAIKKGIKYIPGVEFDGVWKGKTFHFLVYGYDPENKELISFAEKNFTYGRNGKLYMEIFEEEYGINKAELTKGLAGHYPTHPSPVLNIGYINATLINNGTYPDVAAAIKTENEIYNKILKRHGPNVFEQFASYEVIRDVAHAAGGIVLLAHVSIGNKGNLQNQLTLIRELMENGLDGFELYCPRNLMEPHFDELVAESKRLGCAVSGGSDCHNAAEKGSSFGTVAVPDYVVATIETALARRQQNMKNGKK